MRIEHIRLRNFRGFEDFALDLDPQCTLLVGENGCGKTALIDALAMVADLCLHGLGVPAVLRPSEADVRLVTHLIGGVPDVQPQGALDVETRVVFGASPFSWGFSWPDGARGEFHAATHERAALHKQVEVGQPVPLPIVARYPAQRAWAGPGRALGAGPGVPDRRWGGYTAWATPAAVQLALVEWFRKYTFVALQEGQPVPQLEAVKRAIVAAIPGARAVDYNVRHGELRLTFDDGRVVAYPQLSDGYRNMLALVGDLAWRAAVLNPQFEDRAAAETTGVVLVDEIELHLHPRWQRLVVPLLTRVFPRLQFVLTTHSPQVLASAKAEWVRLLRGGGTAERVAHVHGWDSNAVLAAILDAGERPPETAEALGKLFEHVDRERWPEARAAYEALVADLGALDPELVRALWLIEAGEAELGDAAPLPGGTP